jgi:hypothetical protein
VLRLFCAACSVFENADNVLLLFLVFFFHQEFFELKRRDVAERRVKALEELVKERLPLTKWELTPKEKEDFNRVMRLMFDAASILRYDLELGEDAIGKTLKELADWATN